MLKLVRYQGRYQNKEKAEEYARKKNKVNKNWIYKVQKAAGGGYEFAIYRRV
jgi:hypothetical protein